MPVPTTKSPSPVSSDPSDNKSFAGQVEMQRKRPAAASVPSGVSTSTPLHGGPSKRSRSSSVATAATIDTTESESESESSYSDPASRESATQAFTSIQVGTSSTAASSPNGAATTAPRQIPISPYSAESKNKNDPFMCPEYVPDDLRNDLLGIKYEVVPVERVYCFDSNATACERHKKENLRGRRTAFQQYRSIATANFVSSELKDVCSGDPTLLTVDHLMVRTLDELESVALAHSKSVDAYRSISSKTKGELADKILESFRDFDAEIRFIGTHNVCVDHSRACIKGL